MTDIREMRARLREAPPVPGRSALPGVFVFMGCALGVGLAAFLLAPRVYPLKPSADVPTFADVAHRLQAGEPAPAPAPVVPTNAALYAGKSANDMGKLADDVCFKRAHARFPHWSKTPRLTTKKLDEFFFDDMNHFNELMHCLLTEAPARYCSSSQRRMIVGETQYYFRVIAGLDQLQLLNPRRPPGFSNEDMAQPRFPHIAPDQKVMNAVEARLRDGLITKADRDRLSALAPQNIRERWLRIEPPPASCPVQPWWAFWR